MGNPSKSDLWMLESNLENEWNRHMLEQKIYWAQRTQQNWISMGDQNTIFQVAATIRKDKITLGKLWMIMRSGRITKILFCKSSHRNLRNALRRTLIINVQLAIPLFRYISDEDNAWLTREITIEEVWQVANTDQPIKGTRSN